MMESSDSPELVPESMTSPEVEQQFLASPDPQQHTHSMQLGSSYDDPTAHIWPEYCNPNYRMPEKIEVKVTVGNDTYFFPVTIVKANPPGTKKYFGGYRNKLNGKVYHHCNSQTPTDQTMTAKDYSNLRTRETQTNQRRSLAIQSYRESGTQMERIDLTLDDKRDKTITARKYFTSDELLLKKKVKVVVIQRCWRGYMARCLALVMRQKNLDYSRKEEEERVVVEAAEKERRLDDMARRTHPKSNSDFAVLYNELDSWRKTEIAKIKASTADPEERKAAMAALLTNEVKALQSMQQLKISAQRELHVERTEKMLEMMAKPQLWQLSRGEVAQVQTPETQRAKELLDLFTALNAPVSAVEPRLDILLNVKWTVDEFNTQLTKDIAELVDREADLLNRGRPLQSMEKLRHRLSNCFLQFLETPTYNPAAQKFYVALK